MKFYLAGKIGDYSNKEKATKWREDLEKFLKDKGHSSVSPLKIGNKDKVWKKHEEMRSSGRIDELKRYVRLELILKDIQAIRNCDAVVALIEEWTVGTSAELFYNLWILGRRNYVICTLPMKEWNYWMIGLSTRIFRSIDEFKKFVEEEL